MANFEEAVRIVLKHEGGYVNHKSDPGGATNRGITLKLFKKYASDLKLTPTVDALKTLTEDDAKYIYKKVFWDVMRGDEIKNQQVANIVFDAYVNMGPRALKLLQIELGIGVDGIIGDKTLAAINQSAGGVLFEQYKEARINFYERLVRNRPEMVVFRNGWLNRINSFKYQIA